MVALNKKGSAYAWFMATVSLFAIGLIYMIMTQPIIKIQQATWSQVEGSEYAQTYNTTVLVWKYWPVVLIIGIIIVAIFASIKREPYTGYEQ